MPSSPRPERFAGRLLAWWDRHGRKDLPWQHPRTPYRVWVSEIMLQQTQVATVIPYFERWMARFRDIEALAAAPEDEVLALWAGLGYYARARNLHKAARACVERFEGRLPDSYEALRSLPGIGRSTANAILSLAFDRPAAILDGNVKRVLARHAGIEGWPGDTRVANALWSEAQARLPDRRAADYSQAMMDLGALVCTRQRPNCEACPVQGQCEAMKLGAVDRIPGARPVKPIAERTVHMLVIRDDRGRVLLQRRPPAGIWGGLWSLPEGGTRKAALAGLGLNGTPDIGRPRALPDFEHRLTHLRLRIRPAVMTLPRSATLQSGSLRESPDTGWFGEADCQALGLPKAIKALLEEFWGQSKGTE